MGGSGGERWGPAASTIAYLRMTSHARRPFTRTLKVCTYATLGGGGAGVKGGKGGGKGQEWRCRDKLSSGKRGKGLKGG